MAQSGLGPLLASVIRLRTRGDELLGESAALRQALRELLANRRALTEYRWLALTEIRKTARTQAPWPPEQRTPI